eukprot:1393597-Amorphochlora_amoeboformis.AAC.3
MSDKEAALADPKAWKAVLDKKTNRYYYYNKATQTTQWNEPEALKAQRKKSPWVTRRIQNKIRLRLNLPIVMSQRSRVDPKTGRTYYYNKQTKEVSWEKPEGFDGVPGMTKTHTTGSEGS